jgi:hypothetical protein
MKQIIVVKPDSLSSASKRMLEEEKIIVIEHASPSEVRVVCMTEGLEGDDFFDSMVTTISNQGSTVKSTFTDLFFEKIQERREKK